MASHASALKAHRQSLKNREHEHGDTRQSGTTTLQRRRRRTSHQRRGILPACACHPAAADPCEYREIEVGAGCDRPEQIPWLSQSPKPEAQPVTRRADDDVKARGDHRADVSRPVTRMKICSRLDPAAAISR